MPGVVKGAVYDMARGDEKSFWARHKDALHVVLEPLGSLSHAHVRG